MKWVAGLGWVEMREDFCLLSISTMERWESSLQLQPPRYETRSKTSGTSPSPFKLLLRDQFKIEYPWPAFTFFSDSDYCTSDFSARTISPLRNVHLPQWEVLIGWGLYGPNWPIFSCMTSKDNNLGSHKMLTSFEPDSQGCTVCIDPFSMEMVVTLLHVHSSHLGHAMWQFQ